MKTARTISIKVNPRKRRTGKLTRYAANHNRGATAFPPAAPKQSKGASDSRNKAPRPAAAVARTNTASLQHKVWRCVRKRFFSQIGCISLWPYYVILVAQ